MLQQKPFTVSTINILHRMLLLYRKVKQQERLLASALPPLLAQVAPGYQRQFTPQHNKRITKYWQLALNLVCENLYNLTSKKLQADEQQRILLLSVFGPLFDDLFDDKLLTNEQIVSLITHPETYIAVNDTDRLVVKIYLELLRTLPRKELFIENLQAVAYWQQESLKQLDAKISAAALYTITYNKSYYAILLFCSVLNDYPDEALRSILYPVAGLMQLTNDAFDVYKDVRNKVYTLPNLYLQFEQLQQQLLAEVARINQALAQLPYPAAAKRSFAITVHSLHAMGWLSLEQLKMVTKGSTGFEELAQLSRKELVCDMDNFSQKRKWLIQIRRLANYSTTTRHPYYLTAPGLV